jgi:hypothetical protein
MSRTERQFPRYAIEVQVVVRAAGVEPMTGRTANLSRGGLCAVVGESLPSGTPIDVALALVFGEDQYSEPLVLPARVAWCTQLGDRWQLGIAFRSIGDRSPYLELFLRYLADGQRSRAATRGEDEPDDPDPFAA